MYIATQIMAAFYVHFCSYCLPTHHFRLDSWLEYCAYSVGKEGWSKIAAFCILAA